MNLNKPNSQKEKTMESKPLQVRMVGGLPPVVTAYAGARHSRSALPITQLLEEAADAPRSAERLGNIFLGFNHASVGDMAMVAVDLEGTSMLGAMYMFNHRLTSGQERSTRFQDFSKRQVHVPESLRSGQAGALYQQTIARLFDAYDATLPAIKDYLARRYAHRRAEVGDKFESVVQARSFDIARYLLPIGTQTSFWVQASAREWQHIIRSLRVHPLLELRNIADRLHETLCGTAYDLHTLHFQELVKRLRAGTAKDPGFLAELEKWTNGPSWTQAIANDQVSVEAAELLLSQQQGQDYGIATLLTRCEPLTYLEEVRHLSRDWADQHLSKEASRWGVDLRQTPEVQMSGETNDPVKVAAALIYEVVPGLSYEVATDAMARPGPDSQSLAQEFLRQVGARRLERTHPRRAYEFAGLNFVVDTIIDVGAFRDLNRHRAWTRIPQDISSTLGAAEPEFLLEAGVLGEYRQAVVGALEAYEQLSANPEVGHDAVYVLPLATKTRFVAAANLRQWFYVLELRSKPGGHQCYRRWTHQVYQLLGERLPLLTEQIKLAPYDYDAQFFDRS